MEWNIFKGFWDLNIDFSRVFYSGDHTRLLPQWFWKSHASWVCPPKASRPALDGNVSGKPIWAALSYPGGFPGGTSGKESACQSRRLKRHRFDPRAGKIPWSRKWHPTPVFLPGEFHGQRSLAGYSPWGRKIRHDWATGHSSYQDLKICYHNSSLLRHWWNPRSSRD